MTERDNKDIDINDLPPEETLTPEEKERLAGAGRRAYQPTLEALEARDMMDAAMAAMAPSANMTPGQPANVRILSESESAKVQIPSEVMNTNTPYQYKGASDSSAAVDVVWRYDSQAQGTAQKGTLVGDDKSDVIRLYTTKGELVAMYNLGQAGTGKTFTGTSTTTSSDIEAAARVGDTIYWMTSSAKVFQTKITGTSFDYVKTVDLLPAIAKAGETINVTANGKTVTPDGKPMTLARALTLSQNPNDEYAKNYFNIEGFAVRPNADGTLTAYLGFRAPLMGANGEALLLPVTNFKDVMDNGTTASPPSIGTPISLYMPDPYTRGGRGIRDIVWCQEAGPYKSGMFVILAGSYGVGEGRNETSDIYAWNGMDWISPDKLSSGGFRSGETGVVQDRDKYMSIEAIGQISVDKDGKILSVQVLADDGGTDHGKKDANKVFNPFSKRYSWGEVYQVPADMAKAAWDNDDAAQLAYYRGLSDDMN